MASTAISFPLARLVAPKTKTNLSSIPLRLDKTRPLFLNIKTNVSSPRARTDVNKAYHIPNSLLTPSNMNNHSIIFLNLRESSKISPSALPSGDEWVDSDTITPVDTEEFENGKKPPFTFVKGLLIHNLKYAIPGLFYFFFIAGSKLTACLLLRALMEFLNNNDKAIAMLVPFVTWAFKAYVDFIGKGREIRKTIKFTREFEGMAVTGKVTVTVAPAGTKTEGESEKKMTNTLKYAILVLFCFVVIAARLLLLPLMEFLNKNDKAIAMLVPFVIWSFKAYVDFIGKGREIKKNHQIHSRIRRDGGDGEGDDDGGAGGDQNGG